MNVEKIDLWICFFLFVVASYLRILFLADYNNSAIFPFLLNSDSYYTLIWAKDIASGDLLGLQAGVLMKWPLYAYLLGLGVALTQGNVSYMLLFQFLLGVATIIMLYWVGRMLFNRIVGLLAALMCLWQGLFIFYEGLLMYTTLAILFALLLFIVVEKVRLSPNVKNFFWFGVVLGLATLNQANIVVFGCLAAAGIVKERRIRFLQAAKLMGSFLLGLSLLIGMVTARNFLAEKDFVPLTGNLGVTFFIGNNPQATGTFDRSTELDMNQEDMFKSARIIAEFESGRKLKASEVSRFWFKRSIAFLRQEPLRFIALQIKKFLLMFSPFEFVHETEYLLLKDSIGIFKVLFLDLRMLMPLALVGMVLGLRDLKKTAYMYLMVLSLAATTAVFYVAARYRILMVPFLALFAGYGVYALGRCIARKRLVAAALLVGIFIASFIIVDRGLMFKPKPKLQDQRLMFLDHHSVKASFFEHNKDYQNMLQQLLFAQQLAPYERWVLFRLGAAYYFTKQWDKAEEKFKEVIKRFPYYVSAYYNLGLLYNQQERFSDALSILKKASALDPRDARIHFELGIAHKQMGNMLEAKNEFLLALQKINRWRHGERATIRQELLSISE
ncbi:MAG: tetratricopeptide repeat protein [Candidatus Omnitrophica bacterium]|nr:tetratricopeptide repeat protein [Candidatus Omnitrophota bacterium]